MSQAQAVPCVKRSQDQTFSTYDGVRPEDIGLYDGQSEIEGIVHLLDGIYELLTPDGTAPDDNTILAATAAVIETHRRAKILFERCVDADYKWAEAMGQRGLPLFENGRRRPMPSASAPLVANHRVRRTTRKAARK